MQPTYCIGCRTHIPRALSNAGRGLCPVCIGKIQAPQNTPPPPPMNAGAPPVTPPIHQAPPPPQHVYAPQYGYTQRPKPSISPLAIVGLALLGFCFVGMIANIASGNKAGGTTTDNPPVVAPHVPTAEEKAEAEAKAKQAAEDAKEVSKRGKKPIPSEWDALTPEVNEYMKANLKDYDSCKIVECSAVVPYGEDSWAQRVKYRARNGFGGMNLENQVFVIKDSHVINVLEYGG